jgi:hypothetical protein
MEATYSPKRRISEPGTLMQIAGNINRDAVYEYSGTTAACLPMVTRNPRR